MPPSKRLIEIDSQENLNSALANWERPIKFHEPDLAAFPTDIFPAWLREFVRAEAEATQTPPDLAAMLCLSAIAAACAKKIVIRVCEGYIEPTNLYTVTAMAPGNRKSPVFADVTRPIEEHEKAEVKRLHGAVTDAATKYEIVKRRLQRLHDAAGKAAPGSEQEHEERAAKAARELANMRVPALPRLIADDVTPEKLGTLLFEQGGRIAVLSAEASIFELMSGRYSANGRANFDVFLKGHSGDTLRVDRVGRAPESVERPAITLGLTVQPDVIQSLADQPGFLNRGLIGRFLYSMPKSLLGKRAVDSAAVPDEIRNTYTLRLKQLLRLQPGTNDNGDEAPHRVALDDDAYEELKDFQRWLEPQLAEFGALGHLADWASKLTGHVVRVAGGLHAAEYSDSPWTQRLQRKTMASATRLGRDYLISHARVAYAAMGEDPEVSKAQYVLRWIADSGKASFTQRDAFEALKGRLKKVDVLKPVLSLLVAHNYIHERHEEHPARPGRKPSQAYDVNPYSLSQNSHNSHNRGENGRA